MSSDFQGKRSHSFRKAVRCAVAGVVTAIKSERNFRIHLGAAALVLLAAVLLSVSRLEIALLTFVIAVTLTLELINTAIERVVDLITVEENPLAKAAKDISAGAVLVFSIFTILIGVLIFYEPVLEWITSLLGTKEF